MPIREPEPSIYPAHLLEEPEGDSIVSSDDIAGQRRWLAIYTKARQEKALARQMYSYRTPFYLPLVCNDRLIRGRRVRSLLPLFNGYLFLFATEEERVQCLTTNRVSRILTVEGDEQLRRDLRQVQTLIESEAPLTVERRLCPGDRVRVRGGALMGLEGTIIRRQKVTRLIIAVNYLQQGVSVEIDDFMVEPI
jgi:transcription antitermination factor NusG